VYLNWPEDIWDVMRQAREKNPQILDRTQSWGPHPLTWLTHGVAWYERACWIADVGQNSLGMLSMCP